MKRRALVALLFATSCVRPGTLDPASAVGVRLPRITAEQRAAYFRSARLFERVDPRGRNLLRGPNEFAFDERVSCDFVEPRADHVPAHGTTPKFFCTLRHEEHEGSRGALLKVKYGRQDGEVYGEVLGSRLLWALGVAVDADYAVRVRCHHCPKEPWISYRDFPRVDPSPRRLHDFDDAIVQRLYPGALLERFTDDGWTFDELSDVEAPRAQVDALRLLAAFIAHGDDKPENQRLVCPFGSIDHVREGCRAPRLLIADLGSTFGRGANELGLIDARSRPSFAAWSALPVWKDRATCRAYWSTRTSHRHPVISEAGRSFLAARLDALSYEQIRDLFRAARIERLGERTSDGRAVTVNDWALAFERRRAEIHDARCPN